MEKKKLRQLAVQRLTALVNSDERQTQVNSILTQLYLSSFWQEATSIGVTMATDFEFPTSELIQAAIAAGKKVAVPKSLPKGEMVFHWIDSETPFYMTKFGVEEPVVENIAVSTELDLLIVPGLIYNHAGFRIGFGGGYYDRYLANYQGKTASLVFKEQLVEEWAIEPFDQPIQQLFLA